MRRSPQMEFDFEQQMFDWFYMQQFTPEKVKQMTAPEQQHIAPEKQHDTTEWTVTLEDDAKYTLFQVRDTWDSLTKSTRENVVRLCHESATRVARGRVVRVRLVCDDPFAVAAFGEVVECWPLMGDSARSDAWEIIMRAKGKL